MLRPVLSVILQVVIGTALTFLIGGFLGGGWRSVLESLDFGLRGVLLFTDIAIGTWAVLLVIGNVRKRGIGWGVGGSIVAALIGAIVNLVWIGILSVVTGGELNMFAVALGATNGIFFLIAVVITALLVLRVILNPSKA